MFLTSCKDFADHSKEASCSPFFESQEKIFSLLNCPAIIKNYGYLGCIWEGDDEAFVRCVKSEISTMQYTRSHFKLLLLKLVLTKIFNYLNQNHPFDKSTTYSRTIIIKVYTKGRQFEALTMILDQEVFVSGLVS
jgi:hypothetical protein